MLTTLSVFFSLLVVSSAIINGTIAGPNEFPFVVSLQWDGKHKCGGTLIDAKTILTAAHCYPLVWVDPKQPSRVTALLGSRDQHSDGSYPSARVGIKRIIWHPDWPNKYKSEAVMKANIRGLTSDFMLLKMNRSVSPNNFIKYATLAGKNNGTHLIPQFGDRCVPAGWGRYKSPDVAGNFSNDLSRYLRKGMLIITPCPYRWRIPNTMLCAVQEFRCGKPQGNTCSGDAGSPIMCTNCDGRKYVAGFVEAGMNPCNHPHDLEIEMRVDSAREWIDRNL